MSLVINIFGDFKCDSVSSLEVGSPLKEILAQGDINVLNFEAPVKVEGSSLTPKCGPSLFQDPEAPVFLEKLGFDFVSLANNHMGDFGQKALIRTVGAFSCSGGAGNWDDAYKVKTIKVGDRTVGFLCLSHHEFGVLYERSLSPEAVGVAWMLHPCVDELISKAHSVCDFLIVLPHAGVEGSDQPLPQIRSLYRHWVEMGADAVVASHPHIVQPWEEWKGKPIFYSMGNFCFDLPGSADWPFWGNGLIATLSLGDDMSVKVSVCHSFYDPDSGALTAGNVDQKALDRFHRIMDEFSDESRYLENVRATAASFEKSFEKSVFMAGYRKMNLKNSLKGIARWILGRKVGTDFNPLLDDLSCESHRWAAEILLKEKVSG